MPKRSSTVAKTINASGILPLQSERECHIVLFFSTDREVLDIIASVLLQFRLGSIMVTSNSHTADQQDIRRRAGSARSKATIRASLACVQCRSKHMKCDGGLPSCSRCQSDLRECRYAKSRRGLKDSDKRDLDRTEATVASSSPPSPLSLSPTHSPVRSSLDTLGPMRSVHNVKHYTVPHLPEGWSTNADHCQRFRPESFLLDLYYENFHAAHSWLPPRQHMLSRLRTHPAELRLLANVVAYIGSLYTSEIDTCFLREKAGSMAGGSLPSTIWTVQGLLCLSAACIGEGQPQAATGYLERAATLALDLGLQHKSFADAEQDAVLAESFRRTYWALYCHGALGSLRSDSNGFILASTVATVEFPCSEWDYQCLVSPFAVRSFRGRY
jgi:hypothetical protein